jgi:DNA polymerase III sliding clamp (beta) subunit (PCNA family)
MVFKNGTFIFSGEELLTALRKINYAREKKSDSVFAGVGMFINVSDVEFVGSNRHRMAVYSLELDYDASDDIYDELIDRNYPLSKETIKQLLKNIKKADTVYMTVDEDVVTFKTKNLEITDYSKDVYPYYKEIVPEYRNEVVVDRSDLLDALNKYSDIPTPYRSKEIGNFTYFKLNFNTKDDCLIITPYLYDLLKIEPCKISLEWSSCHDETMDIYINNVYLKEAIEHIDDHSIKFRYNNNRKPIEISPDMDYENPYKAYIMPAEGDF